MFFHLPWFKENIRLIVILAFFSMIPLKIYPLCQSYSTFRRTEKVSYLIFTGNLRKSLGYVYAEKQMNRLKPKIFIKIQTESCVGCGTQYTL